MSRPTTKDQGSGQSVDEVKPSGSRLRTLLVWALIVIGCSAAASTAVGVWARVTALDTETYVDTVAPLTQDPAVSAALAQAVVDGLFEDTNIETQIEQLLPDGIRFLAAPVGGAVRDVTVDLADSVISSAAFATTWESINRIAHTQAVALLTGRDIVVLTHEGQVALDLTDAASAVRTRLEEAGLGDLLPPPRQEGATVILFGDSQLLILQVAVDILDLTYWALPILTVLALGGAVLIARDRRRTWFRVGIGLAIAMAVSLLLLDLARGAVVGGIEDPITRAGIAGLWDQLLHNLTGLLAAGLALSLVIAGAAFLAGSHRWAASVRQGARRRIDDWRTHDRAHSVQDDWLGGFLGDHLAGARMIGVTAALLFMFWWPQLTVGIVLATAVSLIVYLGLIEVARPHRPRAPRSEGLPLNGLTGGVSGDADEERE